MEIKAWQTLQPEEYADSTVFEMLKTQVIKDCQLDLISEEIGNLNMLRANLESAVDYWISRNPERLAQSLYRVDLNRDQAQSVFQEFGPEEEVKSWVEAILRRCLQKCLFRLWYAQKNQGGLEDQITE